MSERFIFEQIDYNTPRYTTSWEAPSNIALVKYWGKEAPQLPKNPSISFTLSQCKTITSISFEPTEKKVEKISFEFFYEGTPKIAFHEKLEMYFERIRPYTSFLYHYHLRIDTKNTFPHSSGIASSASAMAALSACIVDLERKLNSALTEGYCVAKTSFLARLGSGSASRSVQGPLVGWGFHESISESNSLFGVQIHEVHPLFKSYRDTILLVDEGQKQVSSTVGHKLMHDHPFAEQRFAQANTHIGQLVNVLKDGDINSFITIVEKEALSLHAMMMTSAPYFVLMKPNTLNIIELVWEFRKQTAIPVCFTLDAGANVHLLYSYDNESVVHKFIESQLAMYCQNGKFIHDQVGTGIKKM